MELPATWDALAALLVDVVAALAEPEAAVDPPEPVALPLARAVSAPGVGAPKVETPVGISPTGAEAEAPIPTKNPTPCPGVPVELTAALLKASKVLLPVAGALMAPTIPETQ